MPDNSRIVTAGLLQFGDTAVHQLVRVELMSPLIDPTDDNQLIAPGALSVEVPGWPGWVAIRRSALADPPVKAEAVRDWADCPPELRQHWRDLGEGERLVQTVLGGEVWRLIQPPLAIVPANLDGVGVWLVDLGPMEVGWRQLIVPRHLLDEAEAMEPSDGKP